LSYCRAICGLVLCFLCAAACSTFLFRTKHDFKYRWIGVDQWAAEHGCNVNIPDGLKDAGGQHYQFWGAFHTFDELLPAQEYFGDHPEYYALYEGTRTPRQLCTSNAEVQRLAAEKINHLLRDDPTLTAITLAPEDNRFFCECPACQALDEPNPGTDQIHSRRLFLFYQRVSEMVHEQFPDVIIRFGAYDTYAAPPKDKSLALPPNTFPLVCHFQQYCNNHPIQDSSCAPNTRFRQIIAEWRNLADDLFIYEYYYKVNWLDLPWPLVHAIGQDIPWYKNHGVKGLYSQYRADSAGSLLNFHVAAALLLDADADVDELVKDFCVETFGPAWKEMRAYFTVLEEAMVASGRHIPEKGFALHHAPHVFDDKVLDRCHRLLCLAQAKAEGTAYEDNVWKFHKLMEYTDQCVDFLAIAKDVLVGNEDAGGSGEKKERARLALRKGEALVRFVKNNKERYQGVIPGPGQVNPYMRHILDKLEEMAEEEGPRG